MNDFAHVLTPDAIQRMERIAADVRTKSRGEMAIVTLPDIGTRDVQEVSLQIGRQWKVGKIGNPGDPTRNAGAVILLVPKETSKDGRGHCFIATGRGTEGFITDADAGVQGERLQYWTGAGDAANGASVRERIQLHARHDARSSAVAGAGGSVSVDQRWRNSAAGAVDHLHNHSDRTG